MRQAITTFFLLLCSLNSAHAVVTVGDTPGNGICDYTTIQAALSSGDSEIRVVNGDFYENLQVLSSAELIGGYGDCSEAEAGAPDPAGITNLWGTAQQGKSAIDVTLNSTYVNIVNFYIRDALAHQSVPNGGHGIHIKGDSGTVNVINSSVVNNRAAHGGGIYVTEVIDEKKYLNIIDSAVFSNQALGDTPGMGRGGGIFCSGEGNKVSVVGTSRVSVNEAGFGGGIAAEYGCLVLINSGVDTESSGLFRGVMNNTATTHGGGVYLINDSKLIMDPTQTGGQFSTRIGDRDEPATIAGNKAGSDGGGVYAEFTADVQIYDGLIAGNEAGRDGGGIRVGSNSRVNASRSDYACWSEEACVVFSDNTADQAGGAIYISNTDWESSFRHTHFRENRADDGTVMLVQALTDLIVFIQGSSIFDNGDNGAGDFSDFSAFRIGNGALVFFNHVTMVDNDLDDASAAIMMLNAEVRLYNSIFHNPEKVLIESGTSTVTSDCLVVNDDLNIAAANVYVKADPGFVNPAGQDYHLAPDSFAVDLCDVSPLGISGVDFDGESRGYDVSERANVEGPFDAGSDEYDDLKIVFSDDFEA